LSGRSDKEAISRFAEALHSTLSCVAETHFYMKGGKDNVRLLLLQTPAVLECGPRLLLDVTHRFSLEDDARSTSRRRVTSQEYIYDIRDAESERTLLAFHWHPLGISRVRGHHAHIKFEGAVSSTLLSKIHLPTSRVLLEDVVQFCIEELGAKPQHSHWQDVLEDNRAEYRRASSI
jgi:hypothetical protein